MWVFNIFFFNYRDGFVHMCVNKIYAQKNFTAVLLYLSRHEIIANLYKIFSKLRSSAFSIMRIVVDILHSKKKLIMMV